MRGYQYLPDLDSPYGMAGEGPKTDWDRACPHDVQFYDVVIDGARHAPRRLVVRGAASKDEQVANRFGFWEDVKVG